MHPLFVLYTWQKHFRKKKAVSGGEIQVVHGGEGGEGVD